MMRAINTEILNAARTPLEDVFYAKYVVAFLVTAEDTRAVHWVIDYGDDEGVRAVKEFVDEVRGDRLLRVGERIEIKLLKFFFDQATETTDIPHPEV